MIEVRLHRDLYRASAVEEATRAYSAHGSVTLAEEGEYFLVRVEAEGVERELADELANAALGLTVEQRGAA